LVRGLVETAARSWVQDRPVPRWRAEELRAAQWRASRFGVSGDLVHPGTRRLAPVRAVLDALVSEVEPVLAEAGDVGLVRTGLDRVLQAGGAARQRAAFERTGSVEGVVDDLVARTEASWDASEVRVRS
jgi:carboxylate-amine ligase